MTSNASLVLNNILELSAQLQSSTEGSPIHPDIRPLRLELLEIQKDAQALASERPFDLSRGTFLLAHASNNPEHTSYAINLIDLEDVAVTLSGAETEVDSFLKHSKEKNLMAIIAARRREAEADFRAFVEKKLAMDWPSRKVVLIDQFKRQRRLPLQEGKKADGGSDQPKPFWLSAGESGKTEEFSDVSIEKDREGVWTSKEQTFSQAVSSLNEHRQMKQSVAIGSLMSQLTRTLGSDLQTHQMADAWQMLSFIANEKHVEHGKVAVGKLLHAREYMQDYAATRDSISTRRMIVDGSKRYLEDQFFSLIEREIARNPQQARLGGLPTTEGKIKAYINLRLQKNGNWTMPNLELVNNVPVWAVLFYLVRAGFVAEAAQYSRKNELLFSKLEKNWCSYITAYAADAGRNLPRQLADRLLTEYTHRIKYGSDRTDPFKQALYKIVGRCDLAHKTLPTVLPVTEDWMWLQFSLVREAGSSEAKFEQYSLSDLQETLVHYGERHFNPKGGNPLLFFQILLLSGQFERAVQNLVPKQWTDAVHFAVVLSYYGLLRIAKQPTDKQKTALLVDDDGIARLSFSALIEQYVLQIRKQSSTAAVEYTSLICMNSDLADIGKSQTEASHVVLRSLILETREFAALLGDIRPDGSRDAGYIERRLDLLELHDEKQYLRTITEQAAAVSEREGRIADAILLYHLSEEYDVVVGLINNFLGSSLLEYADGDAPPQGALSLANTEDPASLARNMLALYRNNASILAAVSQNNLDCCKKLLAIVDCRQQFRTSNYSACLATIDQLSILPLGENVSVGMIKDMSQNFNLLDDSIARNVPNLLLLTIKSLKAKYDSLVQGDFNDQSRKLQLQAIKKKARNLNTFAGLIKYQMSEEVRIAFENVAASIR